MLGGVLGPGMLVLPHLAAQAAGPASVLAWAALIVVSVPVAVVNLVIAGVLVVRLLRDPTPETGHRLYRLSVAFPYIAGSFTGVLLIVSIVLGGTP